MTMKHINIRTEYDGDFGFIYIDGLTPGEELVAYTGTRHGVKGYRVSRYLLNSEEDAWVWDESYMFYLTIGDVINAYVAKDYKSGRDAF